LYDEAIVKLKEATENFAKQPNDYKKEIMSLDFIGTNFAIKNNMDSALFYFNDALSILPSPTVSFSFFDPFCCEPFDTFYHNTVYPTYLLFFLFPAC